MKNPLNVGLFPATVEVDFNGCSQMHAHKAVSLIPFMDMSALKLIFDDCASHLDASFLVRNDFGHVLVFTAHDQAHCLLGIAQSPVATQQPVVVVHIIEANMC
jgi:hypothetical protein